MTPTEPYRIPPAVPLKAPGPGCWDCEHWKRRGGTVGLCKGNLHRNSLSSYAYICPDHPNFAGAAP